jgi:N6-adenosine-specific RNA methylase IME4
VIVSEQPHALRRNSGYPTTDLVAIKALKIPAADSCALFLWATSPMLPEALEVMRAWRFSYRSNIVWVKDRITRDTGRGTVTSC